MARTKQSARKSTGGHAPRKMLAAFSANESAKSSSEKESEDRVVVDSTNEKKTSEAGRASFEHVHRFHSAESELVAGPCKKTKSSTRKAVPPLPAKRLKRANERLHSDKVSLFVRYDADKLKVLAIDIALAPLVNCPHCAL